MYHVRALSVFLGFFCMVVEFIFGQINVYCLDYTTVKVRKTEIILTSTVILQYRSKGYVDANISFEYIAL